jgi:hypothetical protein
MDVTEPIEGLGGLDAVGQSRVADRDDIISPDGEMDSWTPTGPNNTAGTGRINSAALLGIELSTLGLMTKTGLPQFSKR